MPAGPGAIAARILAIVAPAALALAWPLVASAQNRDSQLAGDWNGGILTLQIENDYFGGPFNKDRHYSTGLRANWMSPKSPELSDEMRRIVDLPEQLLSFLDSRPAGSVKRRYGFSLGQSIYTPQDKSTSALVPNERPYAGWLYAGMTLQVLRYDTSHTPPDAIRQDTWQLDVGVVGPAAMGRQVQNNFHKLIGADQSNGWGNQIHNEPGINLTYERKWRIGRVKLFEEPKLRFDAVPMVGFSLGNVNTYAAIGGIVRIGQDLGNDFGPPRIRPSLPGSESFDTEDRFGWYFFLGVEGQAVARNIMLDGNTFRHSHSVEKNIFVADFSAGAAIFIGNTRLAYTHVLRTKEFQGQKGWDQFGAVTFSVGF